MLRNTLLLIGLLFTFSSVFAAPSFLATVDRTLVTLGETLTLKLELSGASASGEPDISSLEDSFSIYGSKQFHSTQIINGQVSSQIVWQYTLEPQQAGVLKIPSLTVETSAGYLRTQPITVTVSETSVKRNDNIRLEASVSNSTPYLHQPIHYTLRLYHSGELRDLEPIPPSEGIIMEQLSKLTQQRTIINGRQMLIVQITYILTPLRSGPFKLEPGKMKALRLDNRHNSFGSGFFSFDNYRPTIITSMPLTLNVQPPSVSQPWLPLENLKLEQKWESDISKPVTAGTPLIWTLNLVAEGMGGQSFPQLDSFIPNTADFRVRSPKPEIERTVLVDRKTPVSTITQSFSLIPLNTGTLQLPSFRIPWWNVQKKELAWAELPAQTIQVMSSQNYFSPTQVTASPPPVAISPPAQPTVVTQVVPQRVPFTPSQYAFLMFAIFALLIALWQSWYIRRKQLLTVIVDTTSPTMNNATFKKRLEATEELAMIKELIQEYAHSRWHTPENASLQAIAHYLATHYVNGKRVAHLFKELNAGLYSGQQNLDLKDWKQRCGILLTQLKDKKEPKQEAKRVIFGPLNPV